MPTVYMVEGDLKPIIQATLRDTARALISLAGATVKFHMKNGSNLLIDKSGSIVDNNGIVKYEWQAGDTYDLGGYEWVAEFEVTFAATKKQTFPAKEEEELVIVFREKYA